MAPKVTEWWRPHQEKDTKTGYETRKRGKDYNSFLCQVFGGPFATVDVRLGKSMPPSTLQSNCNRLPAVQHQFRVREHLTANAGIHEHERNGRDVESREVEITPVLEVTVEIMREEQTN